MNLSQAIIKKSLKRVDSDCVFFGVLDQGFPNWGSRNDLMGSQRMHQFLQGSLLLELYKKRADILFRSRIM